MWIWIQRMKYVIIWWLTHPPNLLDIIHKKEFSTKIVYEQELVKCFFTAVPRVCSIINMITFIYNKIHYLRVGMYKYELTRSYLLKNKVG